MAPVAAVVALALFHLRLFWQRLSDLSVLEPQIAFKWLASAALVVALWRMRRAGRRLLSGRRAGVIWLLALLLHVQLPMALPAESLTGDLERVGWLLVLPVGLSASAVVTQMIGLALTALLLSRVVRPSRHRTATTTRLRAPLAGVLPSLSCRPPPLAL